MQQNGFELIWKERWKITSILFPTLALILFAHFALLPLANKVHQIKREKFLLKENIYTPVWLDSMELGLKKEFEILQSFQTQRTDALSKDSSVQITVDRIRSLAQSVGIEITKTTPTLIRAEPLREIKVKLEGYTRYPNLLQLFDTLKINHPDLFLEEMTLRSNNENGSGKLEAHLLINVYDRKLGQIL